jgi:hypothetical protein
VKHIIWNTHQFLEITASQSKECQKVEKGKEIWMSKTQTYSKEYQKHN